MIVRARAVVTMRGKPIENGAVRVRAGRIVEVSKYSELASGNEEIIDLGERVLLPGLLNAHCHLDYTCLRRRIAPQKSFTEWIRAINAEKATLLPNDYIASINDGLAETQRYGTTAIANLTAFPELIAKIDEPIRTWWFAELIDVRQSQHPDEIVESAIKSLKAKKKWGLAPHAPFTASADLFHQCANLASSENILLTTHLAESREEMEMFHNASGPLYHFMKEIGREMRDCGGETPLQSFVKRLRKVSRPDRALARWIIAHLNELTESDFEFLAQMGQKFSIVHCPRSHAYFGHTAFPFQKLQALGFNICLGTDSLASNEDLSLFAEMRAFHEKFPGVEFEKILEMVTVNPARALRQETDLGKIEAGFLADMIAVPVIESADPHETILNFAAKVPWIMLHGKIAPNP